MSEFAGNIPSRIKSFSLLSFESSALNLPEKREAEDSENVAQIDEVNTVVVGETSTSPAKVCPFCKVHQWELKLSGEGGG